MPEIAEVETVRNTLKLRILHKKIKDIQIYYPKIIMDDQEEFKNTLIDQEFVDIKRIGKWLLFETATHYLLSHLRMEGKFFIKDSNETIHKHEHVIFIFEDNSTLRYHDTRKFGRMKVLLKENLFDFEGIRKQGIEPISKDLSAKYLYEQFKKRKIPMKTLLLDQTIISGLGNIYADEVLFKAKVSPFKKGCEITLTECDRIAQSSFQVITKAIEMGGTTIRSYTSSLGVTGRFQQYLMVHKKEHELCKECGTEIRKEFIGGRSTYYCKSCQKVKKEEKYERT